MFQFKRILMNAVDTAGASGNGAAPTVTTPVDVPQAQGDTVTLSKTELEALVSGAVAKAVGEVKGSIYAEARRTFTEGKKPASKTDDQPDKAPVAAPAIDPFKMRTLDFALGKLGISTELNQTQYERAHRDYASDSPADAEAWARDYFHGHARLAAHAQPAQPATPAAPAKPATEIPLSGRGGSPPAATANMEELHLPSASDADRQAFIAKKGMKVYVQTLQRQLKGTTVQLGRR